MPETLTITDNRTGTTYEVPIERGAVHATAFEQMHVAPDDHGLLLYDPAFMNTASCTSRITYIDGDRGILLYRGYPIEQLAEHSNYLETAYLLIKRELRNAAEYAAWEHDITIHTLVHENVKSFMDGFHHHAPPLRLQSPTRG